MKDDLYFKCENLYLIGDLHLSIGIENKEMDKFPSFLNHFEKVVKALESLKENDILILCGDTCWAKRYYDAFETLDFLDKFKGKKIIFRGNHDYWFEKLNTLNSKYEDIYFIKNQNVIINKKAFILHKGYYVGDIYTEEDIKILKRENLRILSSLDYFIKNGFNKKDIYLALHYPPILKLDFQRGNSNLDIYDTIVNVGINTCFYGHIHGENGIMEQVNGIYGNTTFRCVSSDIIKFEPYKLF
ncbi:MAG: metallophosphoesterase [Lachnospirales bacterium]